MPERGLLTGDCCSWGRGHLTWENMDGGQLLARKQHDGCICDSYFFTYKEIMSTTIMFRLFCQIFLHLTTVLLLLLLELCGKLFN